MKPNEAIFIIRQNLIKGFKRYESTLVPVLRFIIALSTLYMLKEKANYNGVLSGILVLVGIALIGSFASAEWIILCAIFLTTFFVFASNPIMAILLFAILGGIYILYARLFPKESLWIIVILIAFSMKLEMMVPVIAALCGSYISIVSILLGVILWYTLPQLREVLPSAVIDKAQMTDTINHLMSIDYKKLLLDPNMMSMLIIFFIVFTAIYIIKKQPIDYGPYIAIAVGAVMNILGFGLTTIFFEVDSINMLEILLQTVLVSGVASMIQFLSIALDYQRAETVSFEDDENYYYVKIIPKIHLTHKSKAIKKVYTNLSQTSELISATVEKDEILEEL